MTQVQSIRCVLSRAQLRRVQAVIVLCLVSGCILLFGLGMQARAADLLQPVYEQRIDHDPDGIGKFYQGREIVQVMGHQGAGWLERSQRAIEEQPQRLVKALNLSPNDVVADIGAGTGYLSFRLAAQVPQGKVLAVDVQPEMLEILQYFKQQRHVKNLNPVLGTPQSPQLPAESINWAVMVDAYHEFEYPHEMMTELFKALKPQGKIALVEYRAENPLVLIKKLHKMTQMQAKKELQAVGFVWRETKTVLPQQHLIIFEKPTR